MIRRNADFWSGVLFAALGAAALLISKDYDVGTSSQMGPGYFPRVVASIVLVLGLAIVARVFFRASPDIRPFATRPLAWILGSVLAFAALLGTAGFAIAAIVLVVGCRLAAPGFKATEVGTLALVLAGASIVIFSVGLSIPFKVWP